MRNNHHEHENSEHTHSKSCTHNHEHTECSCEKGILENIEEEPESYKKSIYTILIGSIIFLIGIYINKFTTFQIGPISSNLISQIILLIEVIIVGKEIITHGIKSLLNKEIKIELLVTIATIGAFLLGDGLEGSILILLFFIAEFIEDLSIDKSKKSISNLIKLSPDKATIKKNGKEIEINIDQVEIDDIVIVKPGDKIPVDGIIINGNTSVNQSSITGESLAINKKIGDEVYSSTINEEGYIEIKVTKSSNNTIFAKIIDLIKESEEKKAHIDLFIDKFAKYYTPTIVLLAVIVAIVPPLIFQQTFNTWIYRALVLLVISCPCALVISTPLSMVSALTAGTKNGIIIKGGEYIEELNNIKAILFDKTGTLTEGKLEIKSIITAPQFKKDKIINIACSLENKSKHPIAKAFNEYKSKNNINLENVENFKSISGQGLEGTINNTKYYIGKKELFQFNPEFNKKIQTLQNKNPNINKTSIILSNEKEILGIISLADKIRENTPNTIKQLQNKNIKTIMLTGDNNEIAANVASLTGLNKYYSNLLPEDKVNITEKMIKEYSDVAMVGDGVNDTPSLARANVGIAMGMEGADAAIETGDIILINDDISKIDYIINLAKKTMNIVKENIILTLTVKGFLIVLGICGYVELWEAVLIGDMGLTLIAVGNALRASKFKPKKITIN